MILGCSEERDCLTWAQEGVRVAELGISVATTVGTVERELLEAAQEVLELCQKEWDEGGQEAIEQQLIYEEAGGPHQDEPGDDIEVIWECDPAELDDDPAEVETGAEANGVVTGTAGIAGTSEASLGTGSAGFAVRAGVSQGTKKKKMKSKRVRRIHSGDPNSDPKNWEEFDLAAGHFVPLGTAAEPEWILEDVDEEGEEDAEMLLGTVGDETEMP